MRGLSLLTLGWLIVAVAPCATYAASPAQQEYESVLRCKSDLVHGEKLFDTCAACHAGHGSGASDGTVPAIAAQRFRVIVRELVDYRHDERWDQRMAHFTNNHHLSTVQDIADVAAYISQLPAKPSLGTGSGEYVKRGAEVYGRLCASCHGVKAQGDNLKRYPRLAGQHYEYLLRQMQDAVEGRRPDFQIRHIRVLQGLKHPDSEGVADYLSRLGP